MEPSYNQGEPLWLAAYLFFEGHVYGEEADRSRGRGAARPGVPFRRGPLVLLALRRRGEPRKPALPGSVLKETKAPRRRSC